MNDRRIEYHAKREGGRVAEHEAAAVTGQAFTLGSGNLMTG